MGHVRTLPPSGSARGLPCVYFYHIIYDRNSMNMNTLHKYFVKRVLSRTSSQSFADGFDSTQKVVLHSIIRSVTCPLRLTPMYAHWKVVHQIVKLLFLRFRHSSESHCNSPSTPFPAVVTCQHRNVTPHKQKLTKMDGCVRKSKNS